MLALERIEYTNRTCFGAIWRSGRDVAPILRPFGGLGAGRWDLLRFRGGEISTLDSVPPANFTRPLFFKHPEPWHEQALHINEMNSLEQSS